MMKTIKDFCKSYEWEDFLDKVMDLVEEKHIREGEYFVNMLPHSTGVTVTIASEPIHITRKHVIRGEDEIEGLYTQTVVDFEKVNRIRTVHLWWAELNRDIKEK